MLTTEQKHGQLIVLDLEMNPVKGEEAARLAREVIEIGAVRVCNNEIADSFQTYVKPSFSNNVSPYIRRLTGINDANIRHAPSFADAMHKLAEWIGAESGVVICTWSDADKRQIMEESAVKTVTIPGNLDVFEDVQLLHHEKFGADITRKQMALHKAAQQYGIMMSKKESHSALYDSKITAEILIQLLTGRYQRQAYYIRKAAQDRDVSSSGTLIGDLCKGVFEQMKLQTARA